MRIAYLGPLTLKRLEDDIKFNRSLPKVNWGFPLGSDIVLELLRRGHEVSVITGNGPLKEVDVYRSQKCTVYLTPECARTRTQFLSFFVKEVKWLRKAISYASPDVILAQWTNFHAYAALQSGVPTWVVAHDSPWRIAMITHSIQSIIKAIYAQLFVFPRTKHISVVSDYLVSELTRLNHYEGRISVIPNGISPEGARFVLRTQAKTIVSVSQWDCLKNPKNLLRAFAILRRKHPDWRLYMMGDGLNDKIAGHWMQRHGIPSDGIELMGRVSGETVKHQLLKIADVFCSPSLEESFGMVFIEAMKLGVPCVGGERSGAVSWVIGCEKVKVERQGEQWNYDSAGGVVCDVKKPEKLAACLEKVMLDYDLRKKLSENGVKRVRENFDIHHVVDLYEKELERVAKEGNRK